jgi:hypothetical protein
VRPSCAIAGETIHGNDPPFFYFEWYPLGLGNLVKKQKAPEPAFEFVTCFGIRHRTVDYIDDQRASKAIDAYYKSTGLRRPDDEESTKKTYRYNGLKIGGSPFWLYEDDPYSMSTTGRFLCSIAEIMACWDIPYPWINQRSPIPLLDILDEESLTWYNVFVVNFFLDDGGKVHAHAQMLP